MPGSFVHLARPVRNKNGAATGDKVGGAGEDKGDGGVKAKGLDNAGELLIVSMSCNHRIESGVTYKVLESIGGQMHVGHETEDPDHWILRSLLQTLKSAGSTLVTDSVELHAVESKVTLPLGKPPGSLGEIRKDKVSKECNDECNYTLQDE